MSKKYDFSAFDKPAPSSNKKYDFSAFENRKPAGEAAPSDDSLQDIQDTISDTVRGAAQGATFGFADELAGGAESLADVLSGKTDLEKIVDAYRKHRDESRELFKKAEERSPTANMIGNIAGGILPALASGGTTAAAEGLGAAALTGLAAGGVTGLGNSEADLTKGEVGQALKNTGEGGIGGLVTGGALHAGIGAAKGIGSGVKAAGNFLADTNIGQDIGKAYNYGKEGVNLITKGGLEKAEQGAREAAKALGFGSKEALKDAGVEVGAAKKALQASGKKFDVSEQIDQIKQIIEKLKKSDNPDAIKDVDKLQGYLDNLLLGKEVETPVSYSKYTPGKAIEATPAARELLELQAAKDRASAKALGQDLKTNIIPSEDENGNKLLTLLKHSDEQVGASERAIPIKDENGMTLGYDLDEGDLANNFKTKASAKTVIDTPASQAGFTPAERGPVVTETTKYRPGGADPGAVDFDKATDIKDTLNNFNGVNGSTPSLATNEAVNTSKQAAKGINDKLAAGSQDLVDANTKYASSKQSLDILGIDPQTDFQRDPTTGLQKLTVQAEQKLNNVIKRMARDTDAGENASYKMNEALKMLAGSDPQKAAALKPVIERASEILDLSQKAQRLGLLNKSTYVKSGGVNLGNAAGMAVKSISDATPVQIKQVAQSLVSQGPKGMRLASELTDVLKKDNVGRNAALFAIQQNPEYREMLKGFFGEDSKK